MCTQKTNTSGDIFKKVDEFNGKVSLFSASATDDDNTVLVSYDIQLDGGVTKRNLHNPFLYLPRLKKVLSDIFGED